MDDAIDRVAQCWEHQTKYVVTILKVPIRIAEQIPYDHPSQKKLADFMIALLKSEKLLSRSKAHSQDAVHNMLWGLFVQYLSDDDFVSPSQLFNDIERPEDPIVYANYCAFLANLIEPGRSSQWFVWEMARWSLETAFKAEATTAATPVRDAWIIGAAQIIIFQAPAIFGEVTKDRKYKAEIKKAKRCFLRWIFSKRRRQQQQYRPQQIFVWESWQVWKRGFSAAAHDETYGKKCRAVAQQAADLMALQEKIEDNRSKELEAIDGHINKAS